MISFNFNFRVFLGAKSVKIMKKRPKNLAAVEGEAFSYFSDLYRDEKRDYAYS